MSALVQKSVHVLRTRRANSGLMHRIFLQKQISFVSVVTSPGICLFDMKIQFELDKPINKRLILRR
jgi:hypothetical protein